MNAQPARPILLGIQTKERPIYAREIGQGNNGVVWVVLPINFDRLIATVNVAGASFCELREATAAEIIEHHGEAEAEKWKR